MAVRLSLEIYLAGLKFFFFLHDASQVVLFLLVELMTLDQC